MCELPLIKKVTISQRVEVPKFYHIHSELDIEPDIMLPEVVSGVDSKANIWHWQGKSGLCYNIWLD